MHAASLTAAYRTLATVPTIPSSGIAKQAHAKR